MYSSLIVISLNSSHRLYFNNYVFSLPIATGFGDPHMVTLDEKPFTFNGYGEYFILKVKGVDFTLQGRMEPLLADDGSPSKATVYTAFAAKENGSDVVQVRKICGKQKYRLSCICGDGAHRNVRLYDIFILDRHCHAGLKVAYWLACWA